MRTIAAILTVLSFFLQPTCRAARPLPFTLHRDAAVRLSLSADERPVAHTAATLLARDLNAVLHSALTISADGPSDIVAGSVCHDDIAALVGTDLPYLRRHAEAFVLRVLPDGRLLVAGSDSHGVAYGLLQVSRLLGVSPWEWWADCTPRERKSFSLAASYADRQAPDVAFRGIFINDEDWGLMPWSSQTYEPGGAKGRVGPRTTERIFELLLRLRANTYWPPMHECTQPFFLTEGNRAVADRFGIYVGGSHCEPMASSTAGEWPRRGVGAYDFMHNEAEVTRFWEDRVREVARQEILYTIGMRGVHDGAMQGARTVEEQKIALERVFRTQRALLSRYVNEDITRVPQVFIPYKEVQEVYDAGLAVPDDVTLMWCDDNYGYIRHFPTAQERGRSGGNGIYYHVSYWGRPHDYLWLGTFSPALLQQQMSAAWDTGIRKTWILNVGDIKPAEYQIELFMDMAWDIASVRRAGVSAHLGAFLSREFDGVGERLLPVMLEHYRLAYMCRPEFLGNTRTEEREPVYNVVKDLDMSADSVCRRLAIYARLSDAVEREANKVNIASRDAFYQLVKYPVQAAAQMNRKMLVAQLARHGLASWTESDAAYDSIVALTRTYNEGLAVGAKWRRIMDCQPRRLPVFAPLKHESANAVLPSDRHVWHQWNAAQCAGRGIVPCEGLGYGGGAAEVRKGHTLTVTFADCLADSVTVEVTFVPTHAIEGGTLRFVLALDGQATEAVNYETTGRSEEWKQNVLANRAVRTFRLPVARRRKHRLTLQALDEGVIVDQVRALF